MGLTGKEVKSWKSVAEELPNSEGWVLVAMDGPVEGPRIYIAEFLIFDGGSWFALEFADVCVQFFAPAFVSENDEHIAITHWMPLPEPPDAR